jgi:hypothetical protein
MIPPLGQWKAGTCWDCRIVAQGSGGQEVSVAMERNWNGLEFIMFYLIFRYIFGCGTSLEKKVA